MTPEIRPPPATPGDALHAALRYLSLGLSVLPVRPDGSKAPALDTWKELQHRPPTEAELREWLGGGVGLGVAVACGTVSGGLLVLDFESEQAWGRWRSELPSDLVDVVESCALVQTPSGGRHLYLRCDFPAPPGEALASRRGADGRPEKLIETRGQGHYVLAPGCPPKCHPLNGLYVWVRDCWADAPALGRPAVDDLLAHARSFNEFVPAERVSRSVRTPGVNGTRPGDDYIRRTAWAEILEPHGWRCVSSADGRTCWRRPGKDRGGPSATTGYCKSEGGGDLLYVFSTAAPPFEAGRAYSKFAAYALLDHAGDFRAAADALREGGYGEQRQAPVTANVRLTRILAAAPPDPGPERNGTHAPGPEEERERIFKWASEWVRLPPHDKWVWHGYLSRGGITLLSAYWKVGKTTLLSHLLRAFAEGGEFCGQAVEAAKVLYVSEEDESTWAERRDALGYGDHVARFRPFLGRPTHQQWVTLVEEIRKAVEEHAFDLVVFDTLAKLWPVREENDATQVDNALMPLWSIVRDAERPPAVLLVHHLRKGDGAEATGSRGSGALPSFVETITELRRFTPGNGKDRRRVITGIGRYRDTPHELVVELTDDGYALLGDEKDVERHDDFKTILAILRDHMGQEMRAEEIHEVWDSETRPKKEHVRFLIQKGAAEGLWFLRGDGRKGQPFVVWVDPEEM